MTTTLTTPCTEFNPLPKGMAQRIGHLLPGPTPSWMGLALHLPHRYEDLRTVAALNTLQAGDKVKLVATVNGVERHQKPRPQLRAWVSDGQHTLLLRWFHIYPSLSAQLQEGAPVHITGTVRQSYKGLEMIHPSIKAVPSTTALGLEPSAIETNTNPEALRTDSTQVVPIYPSTGQVRQSDWQRWLQKLPPGCFEDTLPEQVCNQYQLPAWEATLRMLHGDITTEHLQALNTRQHPAWQRIKLDELVAQQLQLRQYRLLRQNEQALPLAAFPQNSNYRAAFLAQLPFCLTQGQLQALAEIDTDLAQNHPMQRLLQGDVGCGKTVVAALACLRAIECGHQAALLAPTEVLAQQHAYKLIPWLEAIGLRCGLLLGSMRKRDKTQTLEALANGSLNLVVGTHALVQEHTQFKALALVVVDEQHRFGVGQRIALIAKAQHGLLAHLLMMSATPIPRTLAQTYWSDLAISTIAEKPPGRQAITTKLLSQAKRQTLIASMVGTLQQGQQAYWVCPLIEENDELDLQAAEVAFEALQAALPQHRVALLHGQQDPATKQNTMQAFVAGEVNVLVATTVIEVGVDVPNATLMIIDHAERFGLAQLHQLRGRVGRGSAASVCVLLYGSPLSQTAKQRLKAMHSSEDGFYLAEQDLHIRGPGELLGKRQSGLPALRFADPVADTTLVAIARSLIDHMPPEAANTQRHMHRWLEDTPWWLG